MTQHVTRDLFERRFQQRVAAEATYGTYQSKIQSDLLDRVHQQSDARATLRRKLARQHLADEEFSMASFFHDTQKTRELREERQAEQDAIAASLSAQQQSELRDTKLRGVLRENDPEYRDLHSKLQLALISQTRETQLRDMRMRRQLEEQDRLASEEEMLRAQRRILDAEREEASAKHDIALATRMGVQSQMEEKQRRRRLLGAAESLRDRQQIQDVVDRVAADDRRAAEDLEQRRMRERRDMSEFLAARTRMREEERRREAEEENRIRTFAATVDERLARAKEDQLRRDAVRERIGQKIALEVKAKRDEADAYEAMCLELARQQELAKLRQREEDEARKIEMQHEQCRKFMEDTQKARIAQAKLDAAEEAKRFREIIEQQKRAAELAEIEQEKNRIRIEKFRRELARQLVQKQELNEEAKREQLRRLAVEQEREAERQRILNEERRRLVVTHILSMGPESVKYLPKGVLKEEDLDYLPLDYRTAIMSQRRDVTTRNSSAF
jgi:hypothetical protein